MTLFDHLRRLVGDRGKLPGRVAGARFDVRAQCQPQYTPPRERNACGWLAADCRTSLRIQLRKRTLLRIATQHISCLRGRKFVRRPGGKSPLTYCAEEDRPTMQEHVRYARARKTKSMPRETQPAKSFNALLCWQTSVAIHLASARGQRPTPHSGIRCKLHKYAAIGLLRVVSLESAAEVHGQQMTSKFQGSQSVLVCSHREFSGRTQGKHARKERTERSTTTIRAKCR